MRIKHYLNHGASSAALAVALMAGAGHFDQAHAQAQSSGQLEELVVTARKQEESLNSIPLAVSAFSSAQIEARGLSSLVDVSNFTPGFKFQNQGGSNSGRNDRTINSLIFRGLALTNDVGTNAGSLLFVDGAPIIGGAAPGLTDIERVEVLRGPQSAFFGRSTFSGAVNYVTKDPPKYWTVKGSASYASYESHTQSISLGGPIAGDALRGRISFTNEDMGGHWSNFAAPYEDFGDRRTTSVNAQVVWEPTDHLRMKASFTAFENEDGPPAHGAIKQGQMNCNLNPATVPQSYVSQTPAPGNPQVVNPQANNRYYCGDIPKADEIPRSTISGNYVLDPLVQSAIFGNRRGFPLRFSPDFVDHGGMRRRSYISSFRLEYDNLPWGMSFGSTTAYHQERVQSILDLNFRDGRTTPNLNPNNPANPTNPFYQFTQAYQTKTRDFSQEFRLTSDQSSRFRWLLGVNYISAEDFAGTVYGQTVLGAIFSAATSRFHPQTPAAFGAAYLDLTSQLTVIGELRYQVDRVRRDAVTNTSGLALTPPVKFEEEYESWSPRITLNFKPVEGTLVYALFSRGYRPGGFNTSLSPALGAGPQVIAAAVGGGYGISFDQEKLDNYEVGLKTRLFGGRMQLNADAYYDKYSNGQISQTITFLTATGTLNQLQLVKNVGEIELKGVEGEVQWQAMDNLLLSATFAMNDSEVKKGYCSDCTFIYGAPNGTGATPLNNDLTGKRLTIAPKYTATFSGEYSHPLAGSYEWFARGDYAYRGKQFIDQANIASVGTKHILNAKLGVRNDNYSAELFCTNCLDDLTMDSALYAQTDLFTFLTGARQEIRYGLPQRRMFGIKVAATFGGEPPPPPPPPPAPPPPPPPPPSPPPAVAYEAREFVVYFPFDQYVLTPEAQQVIAQAADYAKGGSATRVVVVGHADTSGSAAYNVRLSERRAKATADALVGSGLDQAALAVDWKGESQPAVTTGDGVKEPLNRRATININFRG